MAAPLSACVDVVIPTYRAPALVQRCVRHIVDESVASKIVVDDASYDDTVERLEGEPRVKMVALARSQGLAHAFNRGAEAGCAPYLLFLNNDILPADGAIDRLTTALSAAPAAGSAAGRLVDPSSDETQSSYQPRAIPGPWSIVARLTGVERAWPTNPLTGHHLRRPLSEEHHTLTRRQPAGACLLVRRSDFERIGGWDERYWIWYEDVDFSRRLLWVGPALYDPNAIFRHVGGASTGHWNKPEQHRRLYHGTLQYSAAHFGPFGRLLVGITAMAVALPRIARYWRSDPSGAAVYRAVLRGGAALVRGRPVPSMMFR